MGKRHFLIFLLGDFNVFLMKKNTDKKSNIRFKFHLFTAEELIENQQKDELLLLTNYTISEFNEISEKVQDVIERRIHSNSMLSGKTRLLI